MIDTDFETFASKIRLAILETAIFNWTEAVESGDRPFIQDTSKILLEIGHILREQKEAENA